MARGELLLRQGTDLLDDVGGQHLDVERVGALARSLNGHRQGRDARVGEVDRAKQVMGGFTDLEAPQEGLLRRRGRLDRLLLRPEASLPLFW